MMTLMTICERSWRTFGRTNDATRVLFRRSGVRELRVSLVRKPPMTGSTATWMTRRNANIETGRMTRRRMRRDVTMDRKEPAAPRISPMLTGFVRRQSG